MKETISKERRVLIVDTPILRQNTVNLIENYYNRGYDLIHCGYLIMVFKLRK